MAEIPSIAGEAGEIFKRMADGCQMNSDFMRAVRTIAQRFTNLSNGRRYTVYSIGSADHEASGNNVVVLFPGDTPTGPSTILYTCRLVFNQSFDGVTRIKSFNGRTTDICATIR